MAEETVTPPPTEAEGPVAVDRAQTAADQPLPVTKKVPIDVPQIFVDAMGLYAEPGQAAFTLATRFHPYNDGTVEATPRPMMVLRLPEELALNFAQAILREFGAVHARLKAQQEALNQAAVQKKLEEEKAVTK